MLSILQYTLVFNESLEIKNRLLRLEAECIGFYVKDIGKDCLRFNSVNLRSIIMIIEASLFLLETLFFKLPLFLSTEGLDKFSIYLKIVAGKGLFNKF